MFLIDGEAQTPKGNAKVEWLDRNYFVVSLYVSYPNSQAISPSSEITMSVFRNLL